jgi:hypothetical protein
VDLDTNQVIQSNSPGLYTNIGHSCCDSILRATITRTVAIQSVLAPVGWRHFFFFYFWVILSETPIVLVLVFFSFSFMFHVTLMQPNMPGNDLLYILMVTFQ